MGIQGLLVFIKDALSKSTIEQWSGKTIGVDASSWLYKGAFSCAQDLAFEQQTTQYLNYPRKMIAALLVHNIKVVMVFDGKPLPAKKAVNDARKQRRSLKRSEGISLLQEGNVQESRNCFTQAISVTPAMVENLIADCHAKNVDCIVAPYEADAQLAFLLKLSIIDAIVTEDSDMLAFGCERVIFKLDVNGVFDLFDWNKFVQLDKFNDFDHDMMRRMCILAGCDYLPSLQGVGISRAYKIVVAAKKVDTNSLLHRLHIYLNCPKILKHRPSKDYIENFLAAEYVFKYQIVFNPLIRMEVPLTTYDENALHNSIGGEIDSVHGFDSAIGNYRHECDKFVSNWSPTPILTNVPSHRLSIWDSNYKVNKSRRSELKTLKFKSIKSSKNKSVNIDSSKLGAVLNSKSQTRSTKLVDSDKEHLFSLYSGDSTPCPSPIANRFTVKVLRQQTSSLTSSDNTVSKFFPPKSVSNENTDSSTSVFTQLETNEIACPNSTAFDIISSSDQQLKRNIQDVSEPNSPKRLKLSEDQTKPLKTFPFFKWQCNKFSKTHRSVLKPPSETLNKAENHREKENEEIEFQFSSHINQTKPVVRQLNLKQFFHNSKTFCPSS